MASAKAPITNYVAYKWGITNKWLNRGRFTWEGGVAYCQAHTGAILIDLVSRRLVFKHGKPCNRKMPQGIHLPAIQTVNLAGEILSF